MTQKNCEIWEPVAKGERRGGQTQISTDFYQKLVQGGEGLRWDKYGHFHSFIAILEQFQA